MRRTTTPGIKAGVQIRSGWTGADCVRWPARLPETHESRARPQELFGWMNQVEFLSVLHIVGDLLEEVVDKCINYLHYLQDKRVTQKLFLAKDSLHLVLFFFFSPFRLLYNILNQRSWSSAPLLWSLSGSNFLLTEQKSKGEKKELAKRKTT